MEKNMKHIIPILLLNVACGSAKIDKNICEKMVSCEEFENCTPGDDHCALYLEYSVESELQECVLEMDYMRAVSKHSGCESEWSTYLSCVEREQYCENDDWTYNYDMCELEETVIDDCMEDHERSHYDTSDTSDTRDTSDWE
jgi:hypothetical protein